MSRYIDEKDVYKLVEPNGVARVHCSQIDELPRADVVEVRHGEWLTQELGSNNAYPMYSHFCKECDYFYESACEYGYKYCPNCGAKMYGERREK